MQHRPYPHWVSQVQATCFSN
uniref:Uncharacterized protein n=1 Tax=Anguilla anguilla TaxID=7936 RepID=A0A0E9X9Y1_ANGAN